jgi:hypothetical protein
MEEIADPKRGTYVHIKIEGKKYFCLAWYLVREHAEERALEGKGTWRVVKGAPWGYPNITAYMVYVPDHTTI